MSSFARLATVSCSTKRAALSSGKRGTPTTNLTGLTCTPLDPVDPDMRERLRLDTPGELLQTFLKGDPDIKEGDYLTVGSTDYPIKSVANWTWKDDVYLHLVLEDLKK